VTRSLKNKFFASFIPISAAFLSAILLLLAFPNFDQEYLIWVALAPLIIAISGRHPVYALLLSLMCGFFFYMGLFDWMFEVPAYNFVQHAIVSLYRGFFFGMYGLAFSLIFNRAGATAALVASPFIWVSLEFLLSYMGFMSHPWELLAHSQYQNPSIIQIASFTGAYGVSFLIILINAAIAANFIFLCSRYFKDIKSTPLAPAGSGIIFLVVASAFLTCFSLVYGKAAISKSVDKKEISIAVLQGNIEQVKKSDPKYTRFIMQTYTILTKEAAKAQPELIIWPEAATPGFILINESLKKQIASLVKEAKTHFLIGSSDFPKYAKERPRTLRSANTALFFSPQGEIIGQYLKIRLLPFGEYTPMRDTIPWSVINIPVISSHFPGEEPTLFEVNGVRFGVNICWEIVFADLFRKFVKDGAQFMVNLTNEAWFGKSAAPYQMLSMGVFRAVENRIYLIRSANTGVSCIIDPYGRIVDRLVNGTGQDIFIRGVTVSSVVPMDSKTIYTRYGDWFAWLCIVCSAGFLMIAFFKKRQR
jgi:apolipoprotein N-acyltransferase